MASHPDSSPLPSWRELISGSGPKLAEKRGDYHYAQVLFAQGSEPYEATG